MPRAQTNNQSLNFMNEVIVFLEIKQSHMNHRMNIFGVYFNSRKNFQSFHSNLNRFFPVKANSLYLNTQVEWEKHLKTQKKKRFWNLIFIRFWIGFFWYLKTRRF